MSVAMEWGLASAHLILAIVLSAVLLMRQRDPAVTLAWILGFFLVPYLGALTYLFFGYQKFRRRRRLRTLRPLKTPHSADAKAKLPVPEQLRSEAQNLATLVERLTGCPVVSGNEVRVFIEPEPSYKAFEKAIIAATHHIHAAFYIWSDDAVGQHFATLLSEAAARGVECRLLLDAVGSLHLDHAVVKRLRAAGVRVEFFSPLLRFKRLWHLHLRNHRKLAIIDGATAFIGSQNVLDNFSTRPKDSLLWHDSQLQAEGPVVRQIQTTFAQDWLFATGEALEGKTYFPPARAAGETFAQLVPSGPDLAEQSLHFIFLALLHTAQHEITIISPYLVPSPALALALDIAGRRGLEVNLILPEIPDNIIARWAGKSWYEGFLEAGIRIYESPRHVLHSKVILIDRNLAAIGSANMDSRSFLLNFEAGIILYDPEKTAQLQRQADQVIKVSKAISLPSVRRTRLVARLVQGTCRLLSPLL